MSKITIVLADDHHLVRQGLRALLDTEPDFKVVGEAGDGLEAVEVVERERPRVLIADLMMPGLTGLEVTRRVKLSYPGTHVIILSMYRNEVYVLNALRNGATGYVLKNSQSQELIHAVREVVAGRRYLSPPLSERAIEIYIHKAESPTLDVYETLTVREREIFQLTAEGCTNTEIAARLKISPRTVDTHRANLMRKLGLRTVSDLIRYAVQRGILPLDDGSLMQ